VTTTAPAAWLAVQADTIPQCLRDVAHWVVWRAEFVKDKWTKVPYRAAAPAQHAAVDEPLTWAAFATALESYTRVESIDGIGYVLTAEDAITGIDLDHCRDPQTGTIAPWAQTIVARFSTYTELSPSTTGLRLFMLGTLPPGRRVLGKVGPQQAGKIEVYDDRRFFTVTGHHVVGTSMQLEERRDELARWHAELFPRAARTRRPPSERGPAGRRGCRFARPGAPGRERREVFRLVRPRRRERVCLRVRGGPRLVRHPRVLDPEGRGAD
jgi:hypothetical protein